MQELKNREKLVSGKRKLSSREVAAIAMKKQGKNWSQTLPFTREAIKLLQDKEGNYELLDKKMNRLYVGSTYELKHRIESYDELDSSKEHPTKVDLRPKIQYFKFRYIPIKIAREKEREIKQKLPFNMDSKTNEEIKREKK